MSGYTPEQQAAVDAPVADILVTAAAGAGKTHVLTGRVIRRITDPADPVRVDRLLIATFTKAAAAEMRERIDKAITDELNKNPDAQNLRMQLPLLSNASISTIDAFCQKVVREYYYRLGIDPSFGILSGADEAVMYADVLAQYMEEMYGAEDADFMELCRIFGGALSDRGAEEVISQGVAYFSAEPFPEAAMARILAAYENVDEDSIRSIFIDVKRKTEEIYNEAMRTLELMETARMKKLAEEIARWASEALLLPEEEIARAVQGQKVREASRAQEVSDRERAVYKSAEKKIRALQSEIALSANVTVESEQARRQELLPAIRGLCAAVCRIEEMLRAEKLERNAWSFRDVAKMCLSLLNGAAPGEEPFPGETARELAGRYDEIYIDEYQDCDDIQEWIFRLISGEWEGKPNIFRVGDLKQSIYRFRRSDPELFREKKERYRRGAEEKERKLELSRNFRSRFEVVDAINALFEPIMSAAVGDVDYREEEKLVFGADTYDFPSQASNRPELLLADASQIDEEAGKQYTGDEVEAIMIGERIREIMCSGRMVYDKKLRGSRPVAYRDIAILLRGRGRELSRVAAIRSVLEQMRIPVFAKEEGGFFDTVEIRAFFAALQAVDNPRQDIPLAALMRSAMVRFSDEEMAKIRSFARHADYYDAVTECAKGEDPLAQKCGRFLSSLDAWRERARRLPTDEFLTYLSEETGWMAFVGGLPGGDLRQQNLRTLCRYAAMFEAAGGGGLYRFVRGIEQSRSQQKDLECAHRTEGDMNVVRVMSIHESKGLEFPIVFVSFLGGRMNKSDESAVMITHPKAGIGMKFTDERGVRYGNHLYRTVSEAIRRDACSEEMRVLYVAMTRAREKLILTARLSKAQEKMADWEEMDALLPEELRRATHYMDWFGPAVMKQKELFSVRLIPEGALQLCPVREEDTPVSDAPAPQTGVGDALSYRYPHEPLAAIAPLFTVTEIKGMAKEEEENYSDRLLKTEFPAITGEEAAGMSPARRGTVNHFVMQHLDLYASDVKEEIARLQERELLSEEEAAAVDIPAIEAFLRSPLAERMRNAKALYRESPFMMKLPCREIPGLDAGGDEPVVVQGIVDCWFEEEDTVVIVDYKTDRTGDIQEIKKRYDVQMALYEKALSLKKMKKSSEKYIYLFYNSTIIEM